MGHLGEGEGSYRIGEGGVMRRKIGGPGAVGCFLGGGSVVGSYGGAGGEPCWYIWEWCVGPYKVILWGGPIALGRLRGEVWDRALPFTPNGASAPLRRGGPARRRPRPLPFSLIQSPCSLRPLRPSFSNHRAERAVRTDQSPSTYSRDIRPGETNQNQRREEAEA